MTRDGEPSDAAAGAPEPVAPDAEPSHTGAATGGAPEPVAPDGEPSYVDAAVEDVPDPVVWGSESSGADAGAADVPEAGRTYREWGPEVAAQEGEPAPDDFGRQLHFDTVAHDFNPPRQLTPETDPLALGDAAAGLVAVPDFHPTRHLTPETDPSALGGEDSLRLTSPGVRLAQVKEELVAWVKTLLSAAVYAILIVTFGFQVARVEGQSMAPTLEDQDRLIVNKAVYRISEPRRGDIVMLYYPLNPDKSFVKRVIAEEGDQVRIVDGRVYVNDVPVHDDYVPPQYRSHDEWGPQVIPEGYYFVMGDHRNNSSDSRTWGFVPKKYIIGKVQLRWWPVPSARVF